PARNPRCCRGVRRCRAAHQARAMTSAALSPSQTQTQTHAHTEPDGVTLGYLAFAEDDYAAARDHWQSAFHQQRAGGDMRAAARTGANLALLYATVLGN